VYNSSVLNLGPLRLDPPLLLAPMAGVTDLSFRLLNRRFGCPFAYSEMISDRSLSHNNRQALERLRGTPEDRPFGIQLLGNDADLLAEALEKLEPRPYDLLDLNAACPAKQITRKGEGAALMREPEKLEGLLTALVKRAPVPVTVKIRTGWDADEVNAVEVARRAEGAGVCAVIIHGRTRAQGYSGAVDFATVRAVKEAVGVPVVASGDAFTPETVGRWFAETGCDGVAVARGAMGNPWIFRGAAALLSGEEPSPPSVAERLSVMEEHLALAVETWGEPRGCLVFRKFFYWYTRGMREVRALRARSNRAAARAELEELIAGVRAANGTPLTSDAGGAII
jgi:tRNA-dihydrouridine synthase B